MSQDPAAPPAFALASAKALMRSRRAALGLSQERFADKHGWSVRQYRQKELKGKISTPDMYRLARQLHMSPRVAAQFFYFLTGDAPTYDLTVDEECAVGEEVMQAAAGWAKVHVHGQEDPVVLMDGCWNVIHFNEAWAKIFGGVKPHTSDHPLANVMRFCLFHPEAPRIFLNWQEGWLITAMCHFAHQYFMNQGHQELRAIRAGIRRHELLETLYTTRVRSELAERGMDRLYEGDGDERQLFVPGQGPTDILIMMGHPWFGRHRRFEALTLSHPDGNKPLLASAPADEEHTSSCTPHAAHDHIAGERTIPPATAAWLSPEDRSPAASSLARKSAKPCCSNEDKFALTVGRLLTLRRNATGKSQEQFPRSANLPVSEGTWAKFERGHQLPNKEDLDSLATALGMSDSVKQLLHAMTTRAEPPTVGVRGGPETEPVTQKWVRAHLSDRQLRKSPTLLMDGAWNVRYCNTAYRELFAHVPPDPRNHPLDSPFRYMVFNQEAQETCADWYDVWMTPWLVELGTALLREDPHPEHKALYDDITRDPFLREIFEGKVMRDLRGEGEGVGFERDVDLRGMHLPVEQPDGSIVRQHVTMLVTAGVPSHLRKTGELFTTLTPLDGEWPRLPEAAAS
ncbi:helix-turn-helix domain-containing protein [Streptomyces sp. NEAU-S7GS2]|uniref:MmyB family transcriptional regulator n=1 Tax=Streptomyces sp. NEAU-S7GS2 TaxID=2202000 RepID=UPI0013A58B1A|nr:helix-turn-helix domain-containing protein [Streptomyces sp. NEAU-S7GS2]